MADSLALPRESSHPVSGALTVIGVELAGALFLHQFLLADDWLFVAGLLLLFGAALLVMERVPPIEARIEAAFARYSRLALLLGIAIVLLFPFALDANTYALHLCVISMLYSVLALALNFQLGSANIPNFATGASYGIGAYASRCWR